ncbi:hypothetical protein SPRG_17900 [Saprolegnia parasitica CBS 223.65]|uniref:Cytochrome P450 n=1 Tax=Saprolegnia parasitica (strain CBS 223.65) TaxID=695850 RepID=A0A067BPF8_SAPPC|nr:hypothetical protein SPRG_17900 [Saprolegnia parasitica CBS 223.65]KDO16587.1 hypothetical protein SPRG_17900 [Saprolegnia parasitica CBS 223.65]|eukprot:XP_012212705.1 hypothetical protein SPRG_17900 [Saprolegnia parasitica CBS 223.65]
MPPTTNAFPARLMGHLAIRRLHAKTLCIRLGGQEIVVTKDLRVFKPVLGQFIAHFEPSGKARAAVGSSMPSRAFVQGPVDDCASIDVVPEVVMPKLAFDMMSQLLSDWDAKTMHGDSLSLLASALLVSDVIGKRTMLPLPWLWRLLWTRNRGTNAARDVLRAHVWSLVAARGVRGPPSSLLDAMVAATSDGKLSTNELRDNLLALLFAVQDELYEALLDAFPNGASEIAYAASSQRRAVPYLCWTVDQVLRLKPAVPVISRQCVSPCVINGVEFRASDDVLIDGGSACRDDDYSPGHFDLDKFCPSRFGDSTAALDKLALLSFRAGKRLCPGRNIALNQVRAVCA